MLQFFAEFNYIMLFVLIGAFGTFILVFDALTKRAVERNLAHLRRQSRTHKAEIDHLERAHATEVAALREGIRFEKTSIKPLDAIAACTIQRTPLMNKPEYALFARLEQMVKTLPNAERLFSQVSVPEILQPRSLNGDKDLYRAAYQAYGNMRVDFLLIDRGGYPLIGIEYQGTGHHQGNFAYREQIKREVFRKAGVALFEVPADYQWCDIEVQLRQILRAPLLAGRAPLSKLA